MRIKWLSLIRVTGLIMVLLYHFFIKYFPGGFVGVDVFYTLSGYLMTALLIDEYARNKGIDLLGFFRRRLYRILPPLVLMIGLVLPLSLFIRNDFRAGIGQQITAALGFVTNFFEILSGGNYENQFTPHLFVHTWSLAVEVQFYLFWILVVWFLTKKVKSLGQLRGAIFLTSLGLFIVSFLGMFVSSFFVQGFSSIYFSPLTHSFPFFLGAALATLAGVKETVKGFTRTSQQWSVKKSLSVLLGAMGVLLLLMLTLHFDHLVTYLVGFFLASSAAVCMIFAARILHEQTPHQTEPAFLSVVSDISYGIYLFHWPLYIVFGLLLPHGVAVGLTLVLSILLASLSFYLLEPYLAGKTSRIFSVTIDLRPYGKVIWSSMGALAFIALIISWTAPALGDFEKSMMVNSLHQAQSRMAQTKTFAEQGKATSYDVAKGTLIIGDSVTLRATPQLNELLPTALVDAQGSRNTQQALDILKNHIQNGSLVETVVIATGVNIVYSYEEELNQIVDALPKGHRLIFVTPYDGNSASYEDPIAEKHAAYVRKLAQTHDFITVADWEKASKENPQVWAGSDYIHFGTDAASTAEGGRIYAQIIKEAIEQAENQPVKS